MHPHDKEAIKKSKADSEFTRRFNEWKAREDEKKKKGTSPNKPSQAPAKPQQAPAKKAQQAAGHIKLTSFMALRCPIKAEATAQDRVHAQADQGQ